MRLRRSRGFHGLKRPTLRQSWNKYNLYNLTRFRTPVRSSDGLFKQKWVSKSTTRKYHGETLGEKHWKRQFRPTVRTVVPMDYKVLAADDGRAHAAGRGSGRERAPGTIMKRTPPIPYANMVYAALERRLETAVFRALFASSTRQARQMCIHGFVKVNGKKMAYPGYMLNPGDLFQVDPERVLHATGVEKDRLQKREGRRIKRKAAKGATSEDQAAEGDVTAEAGPSTDAPLDSRAALKQLLETSKIIASSAEEKKASAKRKEALRSFTRLVRGTLSRTGSKAYPLAPPANATEELRLLMQELNIKVEDAPATSNRKANSSIYESSSTGINRNSSANFTDEEFSPDAPPIPSNIDPDTGRLRSAIPLAETQTVRSHQQALLKAALEEARDNPIDATKPYATPWRPRPFMSAFAFVPRYLEVHPSICSAVYLRHPVARPGLAEAPTPFDSETLALAHNWYLRRR